MISFNVITPFPEMFNNILNESILLKAKQKKIAEYNIFNLFDFLDNPSERIDDYPFGGGPGMLMKSEPIFKAVDKIKSNIKSINDCRIIFPTHDCKVFNHDKAKKLSGYVFLKALGLTDQEILDNLNYPDYFHKTLQGSGITTLDDAFLEVHYKLRPGEPATVKGWQQLLYARFFDPKRYDLGYVGRHKINQRFKYCRWS